MRDFPIVDWVGHSTVVAHVGGLRIATDPLLFQRVAHLRRVKRVDLALVENVSAVLISHVHMDHLHLPSLRVLGRHIPLVVPAGAGSFVARKGFGDVTELRAGEQVSLSPEVQIDGVPANHRGRRGPHSSLSVEAMGFRISGPEGRVWFAGDTDLFDAMSEIGPIDVAAVPIWGWGPTIGEGHLDPSRAREAVRRVGARHVLPMHWGTYKPIGVASSAWFERPINDFVDLMANEAAVVHALQPGQSVL